MKFIFTKKLSNLLLSNIIIFFFQLLELFLFSFLFSSVVGDIMRNLIAAHRGILHVSSLEEPDVPLAKVCIDPVSDSIFCAFGPSNYTNNVEIQRISVSAT